MHEVVIIGTGFAGIGMGVRLKAAGIDDFVILERADEVGGTWRDNHYPGAACDVQSHLYSFSFEPWPKWTRQFAPQKEILEYLIHVAEKYDVRRHIRFGADVSRAVYDERSATWTVSTKDGRTFRARALVVGCGGLSRPALPDIPGLEGFAGKTFHSARWDDSYSVKGKRVAVIGTGASAIQVVPAIAPEVERLFVYQRTPPWIVPKPDHAIPAWRRAAYAKIPALQRLARTGLYWQREAIGMGFTVEPRILEWAEKLGRRYLAKSVKDAALRAKLTPSYKMGCKRILPTNDWYPALQRANVELVTDGIDHVEADGIVGKDGRKRAVDAIALCTGFQAAEAVAPFELRGRGGADLAAQWEDGAEAYLGTTVKGFPNFFLIVGPNTGLGHSSMVLMIEAQVRYIASALLAMREKKLRSVEVRAHEQDRFNKVLHARLEKTVWNSGGCNSWYKTKTGKNTTLWPGTTLEYMWRTRAFDAEVYDCVPERDVAAKHVNGAAAHAAE